MRADPEATPEMIPVDDTDATETLELDHTTVGLVMTLPR
jgi:hypothetical protein